MVVDVDYLLLCVCYLLQLWKCCECSDGGGFDVGDWFLLCEWLVQYYFYVMVVGEDDVGLGEQFVQYGLGVIILVLLEFGVEVVVKGNMNFGLLCCVCGIQCCCGDFWFQCWVDFGQVQLVCVLQ